MSDYRWRAKDIDDLTREEAIAALRQALDYVRYLQGLPIDYTAMVRTKNGTATTVSDKEPAQKYRPPNGIGVTFE